MRIWQRVGVLVVAALLWAGIIVAWRACWWATAAVLCALAVIGFAGGNGSGNGRAI